MKILLIQQAGHADNFEFTESHSLRHNFRKQGIQSDIWGPGHALFEYPFEKIANEYQVFLIVQNYFDDWMPDFSSYTKVYKLFWSIDSHIVPEMHADFCKSNRIDLVLHSIESHSRYFVFTKTLWFPNAYADHLISPLEGVQKVHNLGFCGNNRNPIKHPLWIMNLKEYVNALRFQRKPNQLQLKWFERSDWLRFLEQQCGLKEDVNVLGKQMVEVINSYQIHFNRNLFDDINYRTFETMGCKTLLFTNHTENLEQLFDVDQHLVIYSGRRDFLDKFNYYIEHPEKIKEIAQMGFDHVTSNHTFGERVKLIEKTLEPLA